MPRKTVETVAPRKESPLRGKVRAGAANPDCCSNRPIDTVPAADEAATAEGEARVAQGLGLVATINVGESNPALPFSFGVGAMTTVWLVEAMEGHGRKAPCRGKVNLCDGRGGKESGRLVGRVGGW